MKKLVSLSLLFLSLSISFAQKPAYKKNIIAGAAMTGVGGATIATGTTLLIVGVNLNSIVTHDYLGYGIYTDNYSYEGDPYIISGSVLIGVGAALVIAGPIILSKGIRQKKGTWKGKEKKQKYMSFAPMPNTRFDNYNTTFNREKIASLTFNF